MDRGDTMTYTGSLVVETCCACSIAFAMPSDLQWRLKHDGGSYYCPAGHGQHYVAKTDAQKLRDAQNQLAEARRQATAATAAADQARADADHQRHRVNGYRGQLAKVKRQVQAGRCPCCEAQFPDLAQHMAAEHPTFPTESTPDGA